MEFDALQLGFFKTWNYEFYVKVLDSINDSGRIVFWDKKSLTYFVSSLSFTNTSSECCATRPSTSVKTNSILCVSGEMI